MAELNPQLAHIWRVQWDVDCAAKTNHCVGIGVPSPQSAPAKFATTLLLKSMDESDIRQTDWTLHLI